MPNNDGAVRGSAAAFDLPNLLRQPTRSLLGVDQAAADALAALGIKTVFDLGASNLFSSARAVVSASRTGTADGRFGIVAGDLLHDAALETPLNEVPELPLSALRLLTAAQAQSIATALDVESIRDLANWPPQVTARRIIGDMAGGTTEPDDLEAEELRPRFGQYPTERVYYSTLTMLEMLGQPAQLRELSGAVSLKPAVDNPGGLNQLAIGALLTFEQSWFAQGITLGHLLHSLSLAPGEATRVAVIDWSRRTSSLASEAIEEAEQLDHSTNHARALSEVQEAVASDFQAGGSASSTSATSSSFAGTASGSSGLLTSIVRSHSGSSTTQESTTESSAESTSWSLGNRSVMGTMTQSVNDRTEQHSTSVRNRRATAVREVSQTEHEQVSTRIVANYNHMHALTVQYYEVVQLYRVRAALHRADRCLFVPMELLDFSPPGGMDVVERFRGALLRAALNIRVRSLLADDTTSVQVTPVVRTRFVGLRPDLAGLALAVSSRRVMTARSIAPDPANPAAPAEPETPPDVPSRVRVWDEESVARVSRLLGVGVVRNGSDALHVPDDTELLAISFDGVAIKNVRLDQVGGGAGASQTLTIPPDSGIVDVPGHVRLVELDAINVSKDSDPAAKGSMTLHCAYLGRRFTLPAIAVDLIAGTAFQKVATFSTDQADRRRELLDHLQSQREHYSQAVFRALDSATLTLILGQFTWNGRPLIDQVEPRPVAVAGNYLVLRAPVEADETSGLSTDGQPATWGRLLESRGLPLGRATDERLIPVATGGVFAEAVLGRSNAAEKLDMTRFWHWEDSPIPLVPTEISPVGTGSRGTTDDLKPGQLSPPVLNIVNPTGVPDPAGLGAAFNTLAALNFRDMSGLAGTQGLVRAASEGTLSAATEAGRLASENMKTEAQKAIAMGQIAADIAKTAIAAHAQSKPKDSKQAMAGISRDGAQLNHAKKLDQRDEASGSGESNGGGGAGGGGGDEGGNPSDDTEDDPGGTGGGMVGGVLGGLTGVAGASGMLGRMLGIPSGSGVSRETAAFSAMVNPLAEIANESIAMMDAANGGGGGGGGGTAPVVVFPERRPDTLQDSAKLQSALTTSIADIFASYPSLGNPAFIPIAIVAMNEDGSRPVAHNRGDEMHYSGSLVKVAHMYAAFALRDSVNEFLSTNAEKDPAKVFPAVSKAFDRTIRNAVPKIRDSGGIKPYMLVPRYDKVFELVGSQPPYTVTFTWEFEQALKSSIEGSMNISSARCIQALGYGWINGALHSAGFFRPSAMKGIWLAGDYLDDMTAASNGMSVYPTVPIMTANDGKSKQNTTCLDMARLWTLMEDERLVVGEGNNEMANLLGNTQHTAKLTQAINGSSPFVVLRSKVGIGNLKPRPGDTEVRLVDSEGATIIDMASDRKFVVCFQNQPQLPPQSFMRIVEIVRDTIRKFLS